MSFPVTQSSCTSGNNCLSSMKLYRWAAFFILAKVTHNLWTVARLAGYWTSYSGTSSEVFSLACMVFWPLKVYPGLLTQQLENFWEQMHSRTWKLASAQSVLFILLTKAGHSPTQIGGQLCVVMIGAAKLHCKGEREREEREIIIVFAVFSG